MSTHVLDLSGQRPLSLTINDPARTGASTGAKPGDDVHVTLGGHSEIRLGLPANARIQRRRYIRRTQRVVEGKAVKDPETGEYLYDEKPDDALVLVLSGSVILFGRTSHLPSENAPEPPSYEMTPHTTLNVKRWGDEPHFLESGELLEEATIGELTAPAAVIVETGTEG